MIRVKNLGFRIGSKSLIQAVSFELPPGEVLAVCGPNGAGKSTLLKCLAGQIQPREGVIRANNNLLQNLSVEAVAKWRAVLPQSSAIPFEFTAREIVLFGRSPHSQGLFSRRDFQIADEALARTDAAHLANRYVTTLSGGEMQRVHLARVLAQIWDPVPETHRLLLLDEPTSALDLKHQHLILGVAREWAKQGVAVLVILHDLNLSSTYADRILLMNHGRQFAIGIPRDVLTSERISSVFEINVTIESNPAHSPEVSVRVTLPETRRQTNLNFTG